MMSNKQMIVRAGLRRCMYRQSANRPQEQQSGRAVEISAPAVSSDDRSRSPLRGGEGRGGELFRRPIRSKNRLNGKEKILDFSPALLAGLYHFSFLHFPLRTANSHYGKIYSYTIQCNA